MSCLEFVTRTSAILLFLFLASVSEVLSQTTWFKYVGNPVLDVGPAGSWDAGGVEIKRVIMGDTLRMWYTGYGQKLAIGTAISTDGGISWKKQPRPVLLPTPLTWDSAYIDQAYVIDSGSTYKMWYGGYDGTTVRIGYAVSRDRGITWSKRSDPLLGKGEAKWNSGGVTAPSVFYDAARGFKMWYQGLPGLVFGFAEGVNETTWVPLSKPVFSDHDIIYYPRVIFTGQLYEMWYTFQLTPKWFKYATSVDGIQWTIHPDNPVMRPGPDEWDRNGISMGDVHFDGSLYHLWYGGLGGAKWRGGYAVSPKGIQVDISPSFGYIAPGNKAVRMAVKVISTKSLSFSARIKEQQMHGHPPEGFPQLEVMKPVAAVELFEDGSHDDRLPGDRIFANTWIPKNEDLYFVDLQLKMDQRTFSLNKAAVFTTIGPMKLDHVEYLGDSIAHPGDTIRVRLSLRNHGALVAGRQIQASLTSTNPAIRVINELNSSYGDIEAGGASTTLGYYDIVINPFTPRATDAAVKISISSWGYPFWYDSFVLRVTPPWWRTSWAYGGYLVLIGSVLVGAFRYNARRIRNRNELRMRAFEADKLYELDQMKSSFFANISHEFRTPLTLIQGPVERMLSEESREDAKNEYRMILRNSKRLLALVNQLLDLSKIESGQMILHAGEMDIVEVVRGIAASFESLAVRKGIRFSIDTPDKPFVGWFDRDCVEKILTNLLSNAFKFTAEGGKVTFSLTPLTAGPTGVPSATGRVVPEGRDEGLVDMSVTDTGIGIPPDQIDKVFDRFYQVDASHTRDQEGTGLGLALTKELVELQRGEITVSSEPGKGSQFTVRLPLSKEPFEIEEISAPSQPTTIGLEPQGEADNLRPGTQDFASADRAALEVGVDEAHPLLLIVEDNSDMRKYMRTHLDKYRVIEAINGEDGIGKAIETIPDLIISDVMMPKMDGFQLCEKLKTDERTSHIPVILLTAKAGIEHKIEGLETGADDYITKPFDARELQVRVRNLIEQRRKLRERFGREIKLKPADIAITSADERFLNKAMELVEAHIPDMAFTAEVFARKMYLSQMQLHRKIKALTNRSPWEFVRTLRLERACQLLQKHAATIAEIAYQVGYSDPSHFADAFRRQLGVSPSEFIRRKEKEASAEGAVD